MPKKINIDKDLLYKKYIIERKSIVMVSNELKCSIDTIHKNLKKHGFNRNISEAQKVKCDRDGIYNKFELDLDLVKKLYLDDKLTSYEVADKLNCSQYKVWKTLNKLGLNRSISETVKNRVITAETKKKLRLSHIKRLEIAHFNGHQVTPFYNRNSIYFIEKYGVENNYKFQHAENGGEFYINGLGYWVDGYDKEKNVVIEFDEKHHNKQKEKDNNRQIEIMKQLKCRFIRLNENGEEYLNII